MATALHDRAVKLGSGASSQCRPRFRIMNRSRAGPLSSCVVLPLDLLVFLHGSPLLRIPSIADKIGSRKWFVGTSAGGGRKHKLREILIVAPLGAYAIRPALDVPPGRPALAFRTCHAWRTAFFVGVGTMVCQQRNRLFFSGMRLGRTRVCGRINKGPRRVSEWLAATLEMWCPSNGVAGSSPVPSASKPLTRGERHQRGDDSEMAEPATVRAR